MKKWYYTRFCGSKLETIEVLTELTNAGVEPVNIQLSSSSLGDRIFYYHDKELRDLTY